MDVEQDLENGGEAAGRPALRRAVLTDEQRDEIREAFDLYVPCRIFFATLAAGVAPVGVVCWNLWLAGQGGPFHVLRGLHQSCCVFLVLRWALEKRWLGGVWREILGHCAQSSLGQCITVHAETCRLCLGISPTSGGRVDADVCSVRLS